MICIWKETAGSYECKRCKYVQTVGFSLVKECQPNHRQVPHPPILSKDEEEEVVRVTGITLADIRHWAIAVKEWILAGKPMRNDNEVEKIVGICKTNACKQYDSISSRCAACRCKIDQSQFAIKNKARMGTEHCPMEYW